MLAEQVRQDQIANDLANSSTTGYKSSRSAQSDFGQLLIHNRESGRQIGSLGLNVGNVEVEPDLTQAPLQQTDQPLDLALQGDGFFTVQAAGGVRYTRDGQFSVDTQGRLVNGTGSPVLGTGNQPIQIGSAEGVTISADGTVSRGATPLGKLQLVSLATPAKEGDTLFTGQPGATPAGTQVRQGYLEGSGVNPARAMIDMNVSLRSYEASQRVIHAIDDSLGRGIQAGSAGSG